MKRKVIGEGSYGCVHKPSIKCKTLPKPGFKYDNYVSKIMKNKNAEEELAEFVIIQNIDPTNEYHLDEPILCKPDLDETDAKKSIEKCSNIKLKDVETNPDNYSLLIMKYGGVDLKHFCKKVLPKYSKKEESVDHFWLEVHHLLKGIKFFKEHGIVHNDIKPQNILFDSTGKMKFIDFGLMRTKKDIIQSSKSNTNYLGVYHWSYPFDCAFMNKLQYNNYNNGDKNYKTNYANQLSELIVADSNINTLGIPINKPDAFSILFSYINPDTTVPNAATQYAYIESFFVGFNEILKKNSYDRILNIITDSIDIFGLGFTLQFVTNYFKQYNAINLADFSRLSTFFHKMYDFDPRTRVIDIDTLIDEYENILLEMGILTKYGKSFENHMLVNKSPVSIMIMKEIRSNTKSQKHLSAALQKEADKDPIIRKRSTSCPPNKDLNPNTYRCIKKCKSGFSRNAKFLCRKNKTIKKSYKSNSKSRSRR